MTSTFLDIIILVIISTSSLFGIIYGLIDLALSSLALFGTIIAAFLIFPYVENILVNYIHGEVMLNIITALASYLLSLAFFSIVKSICRKLTSPISGGIIDRFLGLVFGVFRGFIIAIILLLSLVVLSSTKSIDRGTVKNMEFTDKDKPKWLFDSYSFLYFSFAFKNLNNYFPTFYDKVYYAVISQLDNIKNNPKIKTNQESDSLEKTQKPEENKSNTEEDDLDNSLKSFFREQKNESKKI